MKIKYLKYKVPQKNYIILNFDEKWFNEKYIKSYSRIEPKEQFKNFINNLSKYKNIVIVNGFIENPILNNLDLNNFNNVTVKNNINILSCKI